MAHYVIRVWDIATITKQREVDRSTLPSACRAFKIAVYDTLKAFAKLDTQAGHDAMAEAEKLCDILPIGESRNIEVSNTGQSVTIERVS